MPDSTLTKEQAEEFKTSIYSRPTFDDYQADAQDGDIKKALSLALHYRDKEENLERALKWLLEAKYTHKDRALNDFIDLADFFKPFDCLTDRSRIFFNGYEELLEVAGRTQNITQLSLYDRPEKDELPHITQFLASSAFITKVYIHAKLRDEQVSAMLQAIQSNPQAKVTTFWFKGKDLLATKP